MSGDEPDGAKYKAIYETLQKEICDGKYDLSQPFPSEMQLVRRFKVSRFTAVQALKALEMADLIVRHKGKGTFPTKFAKSSVGPVVLIDYDVVPYPQRSSYDLVGIDNFAAGRRLGEHLISEGVRNVLFIKRKNCASTVENRLAGISVAMMSAGLKWTPENVVVAEPENSGTIARYLKEASPIPDAVVCGYDVHAARVLKAVEKSIRRISIPRDIKLAGFDDVRCASVVSPSLTTIHQPCKEIARGAVELLFRRFANPDSPVCTMLLDAPLVIRESTKGARK